MTTRRIIVALVPGLLVAALPPGAAQAGPRHAGSPTGLAAATGLLGGHAMTGIGPADRTIAPRMAAKRAVAGRPAVDRLTAGGPAAGQAGVGGLAVDRPSAAELDARITAAARQLEVVVERYNDARDELSATGLRARRLGTQLAPLTADLAKRRDMLNGLAWRTYQRTRSGPTAALFGARKPHEFVAKLLVLHELAAGEQRAVAELRTARTRVAGTRRTLNALAGRQRQLQVQLSTRKATVEGEIEALKQMRTMAYGGGSRYAGGADLPVPEYVAGPAGQVVAFAFRQVGKPYRWGAAGPHSYDCSGLTLAAWQTAGVGLPHNAARQYGSIAHVDRAGLRPGDLVFFYGPISHVGVYIGNGNMIHAPEYGENVRVASIDSQPIHGFGRPG